MKKLKVITIVGTRPEIIRLSEVMKLLDKYTEHITVHTGQNYDYELNEIFYKDLDLRKPDYYLGVDTSSLGKVLGETLIKVEEVFLKEKPDAVLILGDTNASIAGIIAKRMKIPIFHMEAGNRSFDFNVPEEINRRIIDHVADFNLVYTENSRRHLLSEGLPHRHIYVTGSPMYEVLHKNMDKIKTSNILDELGLKEKEYFIVSTHREENVDNPENLREILNTLNLIAETYKVPVVVSTHPRTRKRLEALNSLFIERGGCEADGESNPLSLRGVDAKQTGRVTLHPLLQFLKPFGFFDYNKLQMHAICAISDSGTISEESSMLKFPAVTIRNSLERPEAMDYGSIILTGLKSDVVLNSIKIAVEENMKFKQCPEYETDNTSYRVLKIIMGLSGLKNRWLGIND
ncbi:UDP-N-acetyl glucosamine 2-epimerase [bacterium]|nr:UDP-N-acetyl glucosamine 2-epimerase [bacterium]